MGDMSQTLADLKDIHLPAPAPWWALGLGWWLLLVLTIVLLFVFFGWLLPKILAWKRTKKSQHALKASIAEHFKHIQQTYAENGDAQACLQSVSTLLRRISLTLFAKQHTAGLIGKSWLTFLDQQWLNDKPQPCFSSPEIAALLSEGTYRPLTKKSHNHDIQALLSITEQWVALVLKQHV